MLVDDHDDDHDEARERQTDGLCTKEERYPSRLVAVRVFPET